MFQTFQVELPMRDEPKVTPYNRHEVKSQLLSQVGKLALPLRVVSS